MLGYNIYFLDSVCFIHGGLQTNETGPRTRSRKKRQAAAAREVEAVQTRVKLIPRPHSTFPEVMIGGSKIKGCSEPAMKRSRLLTDMASQVDDSCEEFETAVPFPVDNIQLWLNFSARASATDMSDPASLCKVLQVSLLS